MFQPFFKRRPKLISIFLPFLQPIVRYWTKLNYRPGCRNILTYDIVHPPFVRFVWALYGHLVSWTLQLPGKTMDIEKKVINLIKDELKWILFCQKNMVFCGNFNEDNTFLNKLQKKQKMLLACSILLIWYPHIFRSKYYFRLLLAFPLMLFSTSPFFNHHFFALYRFICVSPHHSFTLSHKSLNLFNLLHQGVILCKHLWLFNVLKHKIHITFHV